MIDPGLSMTIREMFPDHSKGRNEIEADYSGKRGFCSQGGTGVTPFSEGGPPTNKNPWNAFVFLERWQSRRPETLTFPNSRLDLVLASIAPRVQVTSFRATSRRQGNQRSVPTSFPLLVLWPFWSLPPLAPYGTGADWARPGITTINLCGLGWVGSFGPPAAFGARRASWTDPPRLPRSADGFGYSKGSGGTNFSSRETGVAP